MNVDERREEIVEVLRGRDKPIKAVKLGEKFNVSRQVIVNDIAFIRALGYDILSTNNGYCLQNYKGHSRQFKLRHSNEDTRRELYTIVDAGGKVLDVFVVHEYYGKISAELNIANRLEVDEFIYKIEHGEMSYLNDLTEGVHFHTVLAEERKSLNIIEKELNRLGFIVK